MYLKQLTATIALLFETNPFLPLLQARSLKNESEPFLLSVLIPKGKSITVDNRHKVYFGETTFGRNNVCKNLTEKDCWEYIYLADKLKIALKL